MGPDEALRQLMALHAAVDAAARETEAAYAAAHGVPLRCGPGCTACCQDDLTVFEVEALRIRAVHADLLAHGAPGPVGACAFLGPEGACRVYTARPYVCRTQGLPLRWLEEDGEGGGIEYRDICPENESEEGTPLVELEPEVFWTLGSWEDRLRLIQELLDGGEGRRVGLRGLFEVR
ncbi:MAG: YkgJ family cysteine cluster protein [Pseudomonadota bacterium]